MPTISETVRDALIAQHLGQYQSHARPVVQALEDRERLICERIIDAAVAQGMSRDATRTMLTNVGMTPPALVPVGSVASADAANQASQDSPDFLALLQRIDSQLSSLTSFARDNGYTG
jgi:hypothetical protein